MTALTAGQREKLYDSADTLLRATGYDDEQAHSAMRAARTMLLGAVHNDCDPWVERLADDLRDAGPVVEALNSVSVRTPSAARRDRFPPVPSLPGGATGGTVD